MATVKGAAPAAPKPSPKPTHIGEILAAYLQQLRERAE
jgi:hypothetical protein